MVHSSSTKGYTFELLECDVVAGESSLLYRPVLACGHCNRVHCIDDDVHTFVGLLIECITQRYNRRFRSKGNIFCVRACASAWLAHCGTCRLSCTCVLAANGRPTAQSRHDRTAVVSKRLVAGAQLAVAYSTYSATPISTGFCGLSMRACEINVL